MKFFRYLKVEEEVQPFLHLNLVSLMHACLKGKGMAGPVVSLAFDAAALPNWVELSITYVL
jgi:hypothetical protein